MWKELLYANFAFPTSPRMNPLEMIVDHRGGDAIITVIRRLSAFSLALTFTAHQDGDGKRFLHERTIPTPTGRLNAYR